MPVNNVETLKLLNQPLRFSLLSIIVADLFKNRHLAQRGQNVMSCSKYAVIGEFVPLLSHVFAARQML